ncbi:unnamed protein product [Schistocephalus solidus]|uniref:DUF5659 domain-containing protein n=1 Tax=Schistocephalus solidus TaxID=70667 RepID=A0A183TP92_SCHSO|nr:unnamed protein product [Schistocephalus solidus]
MGTFTFYSLDPALAPQQSNTKKRFSRKNFLGALLSHIAVLAYMDDGEGFYVELLANSVAIWVRYKSLDEVKNIAQLRQLLREERDGVRLAPDPLKIPRPDDNSR